jgi:hypothetical protein
MCGRRRALELGHDLLEGGEDDSEVGVGLLEEGRAFVIALEQEDEALAANRQVARQLDQPLVPVVLRSRQQRCQ